MEILRVENLEISLIKKNGPAPCDATINMDPLLPAKHPANLFVDGLVKTEKYGPG